MNRNLKLTIGATILLLAMAAAAVFIFGVGCKFDRRPLVLVGALNHAEAAASAGANTGDWVCRLSNEEVRAINCEGGGVGLVGLIDEDVWASWAVRSGKAYVQFHPEMGAAEVLARGKEEGKWSSVYLVENQISVAPAHNNSLQARRP